ILLGGCNVQTVSSPEPSAPPAPAEAPTVKVVHPERKDVRRRIERPSFNIEAYERTALYAKLAGYVRKWNVDMGDPVRKDDILAELHIPELEVEVKQKDASVRQAVAEIKQAEAAVLRWQAELKHAEAQYERL